MWPPRRRARRALLPQFLQLLAIIAFLLIAYHGTMWYWERTAPREVQVPRLTGLTEREAAAVLESVGLRAEVVARKPDEKVPEGAVLFAEPPPDRRVRIGRIIRLTLSSGSRWAIVPDVRDMSVDRARALLRKAGLGIGRETATFDTKIPIGYVVGQAPQPGEQVPRGMAVGYSVSKGPPPDIPSTQPPPPSGEARTTQIDFVVPPGASLQEVRIVVQDDDGERTAYSQIHQRGDHISQTVSGKGASISVKVFLSGELMQERTF